MQMPELPRSELLLLDTHIWIWLIEGAKRLGASKRLPAIERAAAANRVLVSAISTWEVAMLEARKRITFPMPCLDWIQLALSAPGISLTPLTPAIAVESANLPGEFHGDPADRILVATARILRATLVTEDRKLLEYAAAGHVRAI